MNTTQAMIANRRRQRGFSFISLVFWAVLVSFVAVIVVRTIPAVTEYRTLIGMVNVLAKEGGSTPVEIRAAFDRNKAIQYGIESISSNDLTITKENDQVKVGFAYDKEIELFGPVSLLIHFKGESR